MGLTTKVINMDYLGVYYDDVKVGISYRGEKNGRLTSEKSRLIYLLEDIARGHIPLHTVTSFDGHIRLLSLKVTLQVEFP